MSSKFNFHFIFKEALKDRESRKENKHKQCERCLKCVNFQFDESEKKN